MQTGCKHKGTVLFLHGAGGTGAGISGCVGSLLGDFALPHIKFLFPSAPFQPYIPKDCQPTRVWFRQKISNPQAEENKRSILVMGDKIKSLIMCEVKSGIPLNRIVVGGFSMGGAMALNVGYRIVPCLAGVFALSSYLYENSGVYSSLRKLPSSTPLLMAHGTNDDIIPYIWGKNTYDILGGLRVEGRFITMDDAEHELQRNEMETLMSWINKRIPE